MFEEEKYKLNDGARAKFKWVIGEIFITGNARTIRNIVSKVYIF
jgi:hypothetical protein